ncbi:DUF4168 domain-containing protein [Pontibacter anaerobius]|uniref:DUF4168 domain-containing protein n=1 Tax=Pontibacter anaerobius TaxID=2993940 RepID=A0ABT3REY8_9BACT|nr:DUF4168 domain-containing protein [Pontibacter anaerobius]MCX2740417.1 DUF4168 domain-containing protein [Pontibacter anaerobius]
MNFMQKLKGAAFAALILGATLAAPAAVAQETTPQPQQAQPQNFSDADLQQFADAITRLMVVQQEGEKAMMGILEEEKLSVDKFNQMAQAHQEQKLDEVGATAEEMAAFNSAAQRMMEMQPTLQKDLEAAIQQDGMTLEKYEQIMMAYRQDQGVQQRVDLLMQEKQN